MSTRNHTYQPTLHIDSLVLFNCLSISIVLVPVLLGTVNSSLPRTPVGSKSEMVTYYHDNEFDDNKVVSFLWVRERTKKKKGVIKNNLPQSV